jgi:hypothetical protein
MLNKLFLSEIIHKENPLANEIRAVKNKFNSLKKYLCRNSL